MGSNPTLSANRRRPGARRQALLGSDAAGDPADERAAPVSDPQVMLTCGLGEAPLRVPVGAGAACLFSARSPGREGDNEDAASVVTTGSERGLLAVADGAGGHRAGAAASRLALEHIGGRLRAAPPEGSRDAILDGIEHASVAVRELGVGAATTLVAVEIEGATIRPYHIGDSEIWVIGQRGKLKLQTVSHSPVGYAVEAGFLSEDEAMDHEDRHIVSNLLGAEDMRVEMGSALRLDPRDTVLLASDGLFDNLGVEAIVELVRAGPLEHVARELAAAGSSAMARGKPDDLTFILFRLDPGAS